MIPRKRRKFLLYTEKAFLQKWLSLELMSNQILILEWLRKHHNENSIIASTGISGNPCPFSMYGSKKTSSCFFGTDVSMWSVPNQIKPINVLGHLRSKVPKVKKGGLVAIFCASSI